MQVAVHRSFRNEKAQGIVEFALVLPLLLVLILGAIEVGRMLFIYSAVASASREAARYGSASGNNDAGVARYRDCTGIRNAALRIGGLAGVENSEASINIRYDDGNPSNNKGNCPLIGNGPASTNLGDRIQVKVKAVYQPIIPLGIIHPFEIESVSSRSIIKDVAVGTVAPGAPSFTPSVYFTSSSQSAWEDAGSLVVTFNLSAASSEDVTVPFSVGGTATVGDDFSLSSSGPIVIPAGSTSASISVSIVYDGLDELDETIILRIGTPDKANRGSPNTHTITLRDLPVASFTVADQTQDEGAGSIEVRVSLDRVSDRDISVPISILGSSTAVQGVDFSLLSSPLEMVIPAGSDSGAAFVTLIDDNLDEEDETIGLEMGDPTNADPGATGATITIRDNDDPPAVSFKVASQSAGEEVGTLKVSLQLSGPSSKNISVPFAASGDAAPGEGGDYAISSSPVNFPAGSTTADIILSVFLDGIPEPDETVVLTLGSPTNASLGVPSQHTATILGSSIPPVVSFSTAAQSAAEGAGTITVVAQLNVVQSQDVSIPLTLGGTATQGTDYTLPAGPLVIPRGNISASLVITLIDDSLDEYEETVVLSMGTPGNVGLGTPSIHTLTITDNDEEPTVKFNPASLVINENGGSVSVVIVLSATSAKNIVVPFTVSGTASQGADFTVVSSPVTILAGAYSASLQISVVDDTLINEKDETVVLTMGTPTHAQVGTPSSHTTTILENDKVICPTASAITFFGGSSSSDSSKLDTTLYNPNTLPMTLTLQTISFGWQDASAQKLQSVSLGGRQIWSGSGTTPPVVITASDWAGLPADRALPPSTSKNMTFTFLKEFTTYDYYVTMTFDYGCTVSSSGRR